MAFVIQANVTFGVGTPGRRCAFEAYLLLVSLIK